MIIEGSFREDLYYRIACFPVEVPPLRERSGDISLIANHFLDLFAKEMGRKCPVLNSAAHAALSAYSFPGNIRELKNIIEHALIKSKGPIIQPSELSLNNKNEFSRDNSNIDAHHCPQTYQELGHHLTREKNRVAIPIVRKALINWLTKSGGNVSKAAQTVDVNHSRLYQLAEEYKLDLRQIRKECQ